MWLSAAVAAVAEFAVPLLVETATAAELVAGAVLAVGKAGVEAASAAGRIGFVAAFAAGPEAGIEGSAVEVLAE